MISLTASCGFLAAAMPRVSSDKASRQKVQAARRGPDNTRVYTIVNPQGGEIIDDNASHKISDNPRGRMPEKIMKRFQR
jgi:hypothetical protein